MYPQEIVLPMKEELTDNGFNELLTSEEVDDQLKKTGTTLVMVNSVCGCSAGSARPGVLMAVANSTKKPDFLATSFAGFDLDAIISMFQFKKNRRMLAFQKRLVLEEQYNIIDHRFSQYLVKKITHMTSPELDSFMVRYRPSYYFTKTSSDYDFAEYIKLAAKDFRKKNPTSDLKKENDQHSLQQ